ncbi:MAG TPA: DUF3800 domain-containing protein [Longimicrobiales bacterium]
MPTLHIHADESGDLRFDSRGSRFYTFAAAWTYDPAPLARELIDLRFSLLREGENIERFHANPDRNWLRRRVVDTITAHDRWSCAAVVVDKGKLYTPLQDPIRFYPKFLPMVLRFVLRGRVAPDTHRVLIYTDLIPLNKKKKAIEKAIHQWCALDVPRDVIFHIYHHASASNAWLQVADYCSWAVHRKHEYGNTTYYDAIQPHLAAPELFLWP